MRTARFITWRSGEKPVKAGDDRYVRNIRLQSITASQTPHSRRFALHSYYTWSAATINESTADGGVLRASAAAQSEPMYTVYTVYSTIRSIAVH